MSECFRCGVSGENVKLYNAISNKGIVKLCENCARVENLPIIKKPTEKQLSDSQRQKTVHERLASMNRTRPIGREMTLRELVDKDLKAKKIQSNPDLAENFHWTIQRIRRARKITREEFAKGINESDSTIRMIEQGVVPGGNYQVISKIENFLKVNLRKAGSSGFPNTDIDPMAKYSFDNSMVKESEKKLAFDTDSAKKLKIADLKEMKKGSEQVQASFLNKSRAKEEPKEIIEGEEVYSQDDEQFLDEKEEDFEED
ncbi:Helix-turn-helix [uncultured archaeon]|nr:Helix-turn-helix [uncultured archaeon]